MGWGKAKRTETEKGGRSVICARAKAGAARNLPRHRCLKPMAAPACAGATNFEYSRGDAETRKKKYFAQRSQSAQRIEKTGGKAANSPLLRISASLREPKPLRALRSLRESHPKPPLDRDDFSPNSH